MHMAFMMKLPFVDAICDNSLKHSYVGGKKMGYEFQVRLSNYRGHYLSCIEKLVIKTDGEEVDPNDITFCLNGKEFSVLQLPWLVSEFWRVTDPATIRVHKPGGLAAGPHRIELTLQLRIPYMAVPGSNKPHDYAILDSSGSKTLNL